jgi:hypothetical protein
LFNMLHLHIFNMHKWFRLNYFSIGASVKSLWPSCFSLMMQPISEELHIFNNGVSRWLFLRMCVQQWSSFMTLVSNYNIHICCNPLLCLSLDKRGYKLDSGHVWLCWMVLILPDLKVSNWSSLLFSVTERRSSLHHHHCFTSSPTHNHFTNTKFSSMTFSSQFHSPFCIPSISNHDDHILQISFVILS